MQRPTDMVRYCFECLDSEPNYTVSQINNKKFVAHLRFPARTKLQECCASGRTERDAITACAQQCLYLLSKPSTVKMEAVDWMTCIHKWVCSAEFECFPCPTNSNKIVAQIRLPPCIAQAIGTETYLATASNKERAIQGCARGLLHLLTSPPMNSSSSSSSSSSKQEVIPNAKQEVIRWNETYGTNNTMPQYTCIQTGPAHSPVFKCTLTITTAAGQVIKETVTAGTRKGAEKLAAETILPRLQFHKQNDAEEITVVEINVGGTIYATSSECLSRLAIPQKHVRHDRKGRLFLDRNGRLFEYVLEFVRTGQLFVEDIPACDVRRLAEEFEFFKLPMFKRNFNLNSE